MTTAHWFILIGVLMLTRGLGATSLGRLPFTPAIVYLGVGIALGPMGLNLFSFDPLKESKLLEVLTEVAVLISLFSAGVKMPVPVTLARWKPPLLLAWLSMTLTVGMVAAFSVWVLGLPLGAGVLLGAILAPTDPVLATDVQSRHPGDNDQLRFTVTCEAGMNDGTAFPFVMLGLGLLGLHELGEFDIHWLLVDVLWAITAAIAIGVALGIAMGHAGWWLRGEKRKHQVLDDLVGLGLIGVVAGVTVSVSAWGFLAVFFAAVALRQTELNLAQKIGIPPEELNADVDRPAEHTDSPEHPAPQIVSAESLVFKEHLERLSELMLVLLLGGMLVVEFFNWRAIGLALFLFVIARPVSVLIGLAGSSLSWRLRGMLGWFGVRGIGSLYYLMYALQHGLSGPLARDMVALTLTVIMLSILVHGTSVKPMMSHFWRYRKSERSTLESRREK